MTRKEFVENYVTCDCNCTKAILDGIKAVAPEVWNALPDDVVFAFDEACFIASHLCSDMAHHSYYPCYDEDRIWHRDNHGNFTFKAMTKEDHAMSVDELFRYYNGMIMDDEE